MYTIQVPGRRVSTVVTASCGTMPCSSDLAAASCASLYGPASMQDCVAATVAAAEADSATARAAADAALARAALAAPAGRICTLSGRIWRVSRSGSRSPSARTPTTPSSQP